MRLAIATGGGDAPGLNAVIRAVVLAAIHRGWDVCGIGRGFGGLLGAARTLPLDRESVRGITHRGGTILGTTTAGIRAAGRSWARTGSGGRWTAPRS